MIDITEGIQIRPERSDEWGVVYQVVRDAFSREEEADLVDKLRHNPQFVPELSLVALFHGGIIGYILQSYTLKMEIRPPGPSHSPLSQFTPVGGGRVLDRQW